MLLLERGSRRELRWTGCRSHRPALARIWFLGLPLRRIPQLVAADDSHDLKATVAVRFDARYGELDVAKLCLEFRGGGGGGGTLSAVVTEGVFAESTSECSFASVEQRTTPALGFAVFSPRLCLLLETCWNPGQAGSPGGHGCDSRRAHPQCPRQRRNVTAGKTRELGGYHCFHQPVLCRMCPEVDLARRPLELLHLFTSSACSALSSARGGGIEVEDAATSTAWLNVAPGYLNAQIERPHGNTTVFEGQLGNATAP